MKSSSLLLLLLIHAIAWSQEFRPIFNPPVARITEALANDPQNFQTLSGLLKRANLKELQAKDASFTLLAPTDAAFAKLPEEHLKRIKQDYPTLQNFLKAHLLPGKVIMKDLFALKDSSAPAKNITKTFVSTGKTSVVFQCNAHPAGKEKEHHPLINNKTTILKSDIEGKHSVIHVIGTVLLPDEK